MSYASYNVSILVQITDGCIVVRSVFKYEWSQNNKGALPDSKPVAADSVLALCIARPWLAAMILTVCNVAIRAFPCSESEQPMHFYVKEGCEMQAYANAKC